jgi:predicted DNA binding CopG/RHH family protein
VEWFEGNFEAYEEDKKRRLGPDAVEPKRIKYKKDLSDLDFSQFKRINWEAQPKTARITMRVPQALMDALKAKAKERGIPYQRLVREAIERVV